MDSNETLLNFGERVGTRKEARPSIARAVALLVAPASEWRLIAEEEGGLKDVYLPFVLTIGFAPALLQCALNALQWGFWDAASSLLSGQRPSYEFGAMGFLGIAAFFIGCLARLAFAKVLDLVGPSLQCRRSWVLWTRVLVYGSTPIYLVSLVGWIPFLGWALKFFAFLWSIALMVQGANLLMKLPNAQVSPSTPAVSNIDTPLAEVVR